MRKHRYHRRGKSRSSRHIPAYSKIGKMEFITAFANRTPQKAADFAQKYGGKAYASLEEVLLDPMVDAVDICTLLESHCEIAVAALNAGKHVLCEKPMATNEEECRQMIAAAHKNNKKLMIYLNQRLYPAHQKGKELINAGAIGKIVNYRSFLGYNWDELRYDKEGNYVPKTFHQSPLSGMGHPPGGFDDVPVKRTCNRSVQLGRYA